MPHDRTDLQVSAEDLRLVIDPSTLPFRTSGELEPIDDIIGQETAVSAIRLGLEIESFGYNIFITGLVGTGRMTVVKRLLSELVAGNASIGGELHDLCYVHNFQHPDMPHLLRLKPGDGTALAKAMDRLVDLLRAQLPKIFESDAYGEERRRVMEGFRKQQSEVVDAFQKKVQDQGFTVIQVQMGPVNRPHVLPAVEGEAVTFEQLAQLAEDGKFDPSKIEGMKATHEVLIQELAQVGKEMRTIERDVESRVGELNRSIVREAIEEAIRDMRERFQNPEVERYLEEVEENVLDHAELFQQDEQEEERESGEFDPLHYYRVNVIVDNRQRTTPPIVTETFLTFQSLFGAVEGAGDRERGRRADFSHVRAGAILRAEGGYLVLNALDVFADPQVWPALKRTLRTGRVEIRAADSPFMQWGGALQPEAVAIRTKVVMIGDARLHSILYQMEDDFRKIFKVKAEFDSLMPRTSDTQVKLSRFVSMIGVSNDLQPFDCSAVAKIIEHGARFAGHRDKLSTHFTYLKDVIIEADYWARKAETDHVRAEHVVRALNEARARVGLSERRAREAVERDQILIDVGGEEVGQINGLAVYSLGDHAFGMPSRITATVGVGAAGIVNIEREVRMSGATHDKGVLILSGFLRERFAQETPIALTASICFEQSYSGVDGDSASSTEIYALMSALADVPIQQGIAVRRSAAHRRGEREDRGFLRRVPGPG
jgi:ATP-dependent Lon protease